MLILFKYSSISRLFTISLLTISLVFVYSCKENSNDQKAAKKKVDQSIKIRVSSELKSLNPLKVRDQFSDYICKHIYQPLLAEDYESSNLVGVLAKSRPKIERKSGQIILHYEIRKNAQFDSTHPVTPKDVLFSLKLNSSPILNPYYYNYYEFIDSLVIHDSSKFSIYGSGNYILNEFASGDYYILPQYMLGPDLISDSYTLTQFKKTGNFHNTEIIQIEKQLEKFKFEQAKLALGSGPYELSFHQSGELLRLKKKENWWGNASNNNSFYQIEAKQLEYLTIKDDNAAINTLLNKGIDLLTDLENSNIDRIPKDSANFISTNTLVFEYLGMNLQNDYLQDLNLRKAIAFSIPKEQIITTLLYGNAEASIFPYGANKFQLQEYAYNTDSAIYYRKLIQAKENEQIELTYAYNSGNERRKLVGLILKNELKKIGINLEIQAYEWGVYLEKLKNGDFDVFMNGSATSSLPPDFSSMYSSAAALNGRNYANYKNSKVDRLIDSINYYSGKDQREKLISEFAKIINQELPYIFLYKIKASLVFGPQVKNPKAYAIRPNYWAPSLIKE